MPDAHRFYRNMLCKPCGIWLPARKVIFGNLYQRWGRHLQTHVAQPFLGKIEPNA